MSNDLRVNSVDRFQKNSERLVLEEHSHCEVPAGCGGVVLRWFNPNSGIPAILYAGFADKMRIWIDEAEVTSGRVTIPYGEHMLAIHCEFKESALLRFAFAGLRDTPPHYPDDERVIPTLLSAGDWTWLATFENPRTSRWNAADFDDSQWTPLEPARIDVETLESSIRWRCEQLLRFGAAALNLNEQREVWIRKRFEMEE